MLYEVLAALWEGPGNDHEIARTIEARTGARFSAEAAERYLRLLRDCGYANARDDPRGPRYTMTPDGSTLLARLAREIEEKEYHYA